MSYIDNPWSYETLPRIYLIDSKFNIKSLGYYDPDFGTDTDFAYKPGRFVNESGESFYNDSAYREKHCMVISFKHATLGNLPILRKSGYGHFHVKYLVSTNAIRINDVIEKDPETQDLFIFASLAHSPPMTIIYGDNSQETLYEIAPHASRIELEKLGKDINFFVKIKELYRDAEAKAQQLESKNFVLTVRNVAAESTIIQLQSNVNDLLKNYQIAQDKLTNLRLSVVERIGKGIEAVESEYNFSLPWDKLMLEEIDKTSAMMQTDIRSVQAMIKLSGSLTITQKQQLCLQVANVVGYDYLKQFIGSVAEYNAPTGTVDGQRMNISKSMSPNEMIIAYAQLYQNGTMKEEDYRRAIEEQLNKLRSNLRTQDPNSAIQQSREDLVQKLAPASTEAR